MGFVGGHWIYLVILFVIILIIWGPGKMPDVGAGLGRAIREFRKASSETHDTIINATTGSAQTPAPAPAPAATPTPAPTPAPAETPQTTETSSQTPVAH
jgi:sec-independent protein translocase protein TatA